MISRHNMSSYSIYLEHDIYYGAVPPTPSSYEDQPKIPDAYSSLLNQALRLGNIVGYAQEQNGRLIHNVFPIKKMETEQISSSSKVDLAFHTETAFHPYRPDYVVLACLRGDENAATTYADVNDIVAEIPQSAIPELMKKQFITTVDMSFRLNGEEDQSVDTAVLEETENGYRFTYDETVMSGKSKEADFALSLVSNAISKVKKEIVLKAGDILVLNNDKVVHGRNHFTPRYDGTDRWLLRCLVRKELPPESDRVGSVITTTRFK